MENNQIVAVSQMGKEIVWEKNIIRIPFNTQDERDRRIYGMLKSLQDEVDRLKKEREELELLYITKDQARKRIIDFLKSKKNEGHGKIEIFEISSHLKIPAQQIEEILDALLKEGLVKEL
jgi:tRNA G26 N,N-dimethylase Trm1